MRPEAVTWMRLVRVHETVSREMEARLRPFGLSVAQFDILAHVGAVEGRSQQAVAAALLTTKGNMCQLLDRMEIAGLVRRQRQGRSKRLYLTESGRDLWREVVPAHEAWLAERLAVLGPGDLALLGRVLRRLDHGLAGRPLRTDEGGLG